MFKRLRVCGVALAMIAPCVAGCEGAAEHQPTVGHTGKTGHGGGQHALGENPEAEMKRIQQGAGRGAEASPGHLPGR